MKMSGKLLSAVIVSALLCSFTFLQVSFSGTWSLNESKSELGQFGARVAATKMVVDQKADGITITRTTNGSDAAETLVDGKEAESTVFNGMGKRKSTIKWTADRNGFSINANTALDRNGQTMEIKSAETWSLSADGKVLTIQNNISTPQGDITTKAVYEKQ